MRARARRAIALLSSLLVMQLTLTGSGHACPMHASQSAQRQMAPDAHAMGHGSTVAEHQLTRLAIAGEMGTLGHCEFPCAPAACGSAVTCGATAAVVAGSGPSLASFASTNVIDLTALAPRSPATGPEPPPPRS